jgi:hypothetical protein
MGENFSDYINPAEQRHEISTHGVFWHSNDETRVREVERKARKTPRLVAAASAGNEQELARGPQALSQ